MAALMAGQTLGDACATAAEEFDLTGLLTLLLAGGAIAGILQND